MHQLHAGLWWRIACSTDLPFSATAMQSINSWLKRPHIACSKHLAQATTVSSLLPGMRRALAQQNKRKLQLVTPPMSPPEVFLLLTTLSLPSHMSIPVCRI